MRVPVFQSVQFIFQNFFYLCRINCIDDQHNAVSKKGFFLLISLVLKGKEPFSPCFLCKIHDLIYVLLRIVLISLNDNSHMLRNIFEISDRKSNNGSGDRAAKSNCHTGDVDKVLDGRPDNSGRRVKNDTENNQPKTDYQPHYTGKIHTNTSLR
ncbi:hypothetical protein SDC9_206084 [bioreactor metagenome]|uniref:Uncharacterized protein n=1 Tax=bioreactor metagenome TaxID=1076179 RepID=A0A645J6Q9_9ZZZZ